MSERISGVPQQVASQLTYNKDTPILVIWNKRYIWQEFFACLKRRANLFQETSPRCANIGSDKGLMLNKQQAITRISSDTSHDAFTHHPVSMS